MVEMNGLHDLKMYSQYDCHCRLRVDKLLMYAHTLGGCGWSHFIVWES